MNKVVPMEMATTQAVPVAVAPPNPHFSALQTSEIMRKVPNLLPLNKVDTDEFAALLNLGSRGERVSACNNSKFASKVDCTLLENNLQIYDNVNRYKLFLKVFLLMTGLIFLAFSAAMIVEPNPEDVDTEEKRKHRKAGLKTMGTLMFLASLVIIPLMLYALTRNSFAVRWR